MGRYRPVARLDVLDGEGISASKDGGEHFVILLNVYEGGVGGSVASAMAAGGSSAAEGHGLKVGERSKATILLKVFDNPLCILLAKSITRGDILCNALARGQVLNNCFSGSCEMSGDGGLDNVTSGDSDVREIAGGIGVPLVPSCSINK